jgi:hypothetical protein
VLVCHWAKHLRATFTSNSGYQTDHTMKDFVRVVLAKYFSNRPLARFFEFQNFVVIHAVMCVLDLASVRLRLFVLAG